MASPVNGRVGRSGMGYLGTWDAGGVELRYDNVKRRSGELHGELQVSAAIVPANRGRIHRASFNASSTASREKLAKTLRDRSGGVDINWPDVVEEFSASVLELEQAGADVVVVGNLPAAPFDGFLVEPFLVVGRPTIVYAAGGTGKSYLAALLAAAVATGTDVLGWKVAKGPVLYLDWETDEYEIDERVKRVAAGLGIASPSVFYRACGRPLDQQAEAIARIVDDEGIALVIVDSVGMAMARQGEHGSMEETAISLFTAFRQIGTTILAIDHVTGDDAAKDGATTKPYGSIYKVNLARSVWELKSAGPAVNGVAHGALHHRKVNRGALLPAVGIAVEHTPTSVVFRREEVTDEGLARALSNSVRIQRLLGANGPSAVPVIATELGLAEGIVRITLARGRGTIFKADAGIWTIA